MITLENHLAASSITIVGLLFSGLSHQNQWSQRAKLLNYWQGLDQPPPRSLLQNSQLCFHLCDFHFFSFCRFCSCLVQLSLIIPNNLFRSVLLHKISYVGLFSFQPSIIFLTKISFKSCFLILHAHCPRDRRIFVQSTVSSCVFC